MSKDQHLPASMFYFAAFAITLIITVIIGINVSNMNTHSQNEMKEYSIGNFETCGYIGVQITYDKEPVDVVLYDPNDCKYTAMSKNVYYKIDKNRKTVTLLADSNVTGLWSASFNEKRNKKINYCRIEQPSGTLYVANPVVYTKSDGQYYMKIKPIMSGNSNIKARYSLILDKSPFSYDMGSGDITLDKETNIPLKFPKDAFTDADYSLNINIKTTSGKSINQSVTVHLDHYTKIKKSVVSPDEKTGKRKDKNANHK